jgi:hypothetical protein
MNTADREHFNKEERDAVNTLRKLHQGKLGAHWIWCALQQIAAGQDEAQVLRDFGYTFSAISAPQEGCESVPVGELVALRRNAKRYEVIRDGRHGFNAYRLSPKPGKRWRGYGDEGEIFFGDELDKQIDNALADRPQASSDGGRGGKA